MSATTFTVTTTADSGAGSLRDALTLAQNCTGAPHTIVFNVPLGSLTGGVAVITPLSALPAITCAGTTVDGTTQTTNQGNTNNVLLGSGGTTGTGPDGRSNSGDESFLPQLNGPEVEIVGSNLSDSTLVIQPDNVTIRGLSIHGGGDFGGVATSTASIQVFGTGTLIEQNVIGASAASYTSPAGAAQTQSNLILISAGGNITIQNNLMGFARWRSVLLFNSSITNVLILQNEFNGSFDGIDYRSPGFALSGGPSGTVSIERNLFHDFAENGSGSTRFGVFVRHTDGSSTILDNTFFNVGAGAIIDCFRPVAFQNNIVSNGALDAVTVFFGRAAPANSARISLNSIFGNRLGIDLGNDGITPNDGFYGPHRVNLSMDYPIFTVASVFGSTLTIAGYIGNNPAGSAAFANATVEVFTANNVPPNQNGEIIAGDGFSVPHGEGETYLGTVIADSLGRFAATLPLPGSVTLVDGDGVMATATDAAGNTSEFGPNAVLPTPGPAAVVPTLSFPMLALLALALVGAGLFAVRRL